MFIFGFKHPPVELTVSHLPTAGEESLARVANCEPYLRRWKSHVEPVLPIVPEPKVRNRRRPSPVRPPSGRSRRTQQLGEERHIRNDQQAGRRVAHQRECQINARERDVLQGEVENAVHNGEHHRKVLRDLDRGVPHGPDDACGLRVVRLCLHIQARRVRSQHTVRGTLHMLQFWMLGCWTRIPIPWQGDRFSMLLVLPKKKNGCAQLSRDMIHVTVEDVMSQLRRQEVRVEIPRFAVESHSDLIPHLEKLQILQVFTPGANLSGVSTNKNEKLLVNNVFHSAKLIVDETGTEAAASMGKFQYR